MDSDLTDNDSFYSDGYNTPDYDSDNFEAEKLNPEAFDYKEIDQTKAETFLNEEINSLCTLIGVPLEIARLLLIFYKWDVEIIKSTFLANALGVLIKNNILPGLNTLPTCSDSQSIMVTLRLAHQLGCCVKPYFIAPKTSPDPCCSVCFCPAPFNTPDYHNIVDSNQSCIPTSKRDLTVYGLYGLSCGHRFCTDCWVSYLSLKIENALSIDIKCMSDGCGVLVIEDFVLAILNDASKLKRYKELIFQYMVECHPSIISCLGSNCPMFIRVLEKPKARCIQCNYCRAKYCFLCGEAYHAPISCKILKMWQVKSRDDNGTANYISVNTKDCPKCNVCIEKNDGCNHMRCYLCKYDFCWNCLGNWSTHETEYYFCSRYNKSQNVGKGKDRGRAREALERYVFYFERYQNHERSLKLEEENRQRIQRRINDKVMQKEGTWIDWQYLLDAADTLRKCRYTLKYTYPHAYYGKKLKRIELFEYQQAQLEAEVEDLSWKIEHAEITDRADLQNKMEVCEKHRITLLQEFLDD